MKNILIYVIIISVCIICLLTLRNNKNEEQGTYSKGYYKLVDRYDSDDSSYSDFLKQKDSISILENTYKELMSMKEILYFELSNQDIGYIGDFKGKKQFLHGGESVRNQKIDGELYSPLYAIQSSENYYDKNHLAAMMDEGNIFSENDYKVTSEDDIPVILGNAYKTLFSLNSRFQGIYLGEKKLKFKVIGFLKKGEEIEINQNHHVLDYYMIMPQLNVASLDSHSFKKRLLSVKVEGVCYYENKKKYKEIKKKIKEISRKTKFKYDSSYGG